MSHFLITGGVALGGSVWASGTETAKLTASDDAFNDTLGWSVALSGDGSTVAAGARYAAIGGKSAQGAAYVFTMSGPGWANMTQTAKLAASDGAAGDFFGYSVAISGDTVVVGAYEEESNATGVNGNQTDNSATGSGAARGNPWSAAE